MWFIAVPVILVLLIVFALCIPLNLTVHADVHGRPRFRLRFSWLFGMVSGEISREKEKPAREERVTKGRKKRWPPDIRNIFSLLKSRGAWPWLKRLLKDIFACFRLSDLVADFRVGLGDPADTGLLFACLGPATAFLGSSRWHRIRLEPSFGGEAIFEGFSQGRARLQPIQLVPVLLKSALSPTAFRLAVTLIKSRWKRKR